MSYIFLSKKTETNRIEEIELELLPTGEFSESLIINLTQAQYDELTEDEKQLKLIYNITDVVESTTSEVPDNGTEGQVLTWSSGIPVWADSTDSFSVVSLTQAQYDALTPEEKQLDVIYHITDTIEPVIISVPTGGTTGQVLAKNSGDDGDTIWVQINQVPDPSGQPDNKILTTASGSAVWGNLPISAVVELTQAAYDALTPPNATTLYIITDA